MKDNILCMNKKLPVNIAGLLMVFAILAMPLIITHVATVPNCALLLLCISSFYVVGAALLVPVNISSTLLPISHTGISVFIGALVTSMLLFITQSVPILIVVMLLFFMLLLLGFRKHLEISVLPGKPGMVLYGLVLLIILLLAAGDLSKQLSAVQPATNCYTIDSYYFTSIVSSIRHGSIFNASFEAGTPINYQVLGFFIPSYLAVVLNISSHQALWGLAYPFYQFLALLLCYELCYFFLKDKIARTNYLFIFLAVGLPILMAPLHPLYLAKGVVKNFIFNGLGYLVPAGTITYPVTIVVLLFTFLLFSRIDWINRRITADKVFFSLGLGLMVIGKIPLFVGSVIFMGVIVLKRVIKGKERFMSYFWYFLSAFVFAGILFKICMGQASGGKNFFEFGYLVQLFGGWFGRSNKGLSNTLIIMAMMPFTYILWMGIRILGLLMLIKSKNHRLNELFVGMAFTLWGTSILASFLHMQIMGNDGRLLMDNTFNIDQFIRSGFYIMTIAATIGLLSLIYGGHLKPRLLTGLYIALGLWCTLTLTSLIYAARQHKKDCSPIAWYDENYQLLKAGKCNDGLIVVNPTTQYYGSLLASCDYGRYWSVIDAKSYNLSIKNEYRWNLFQEMLVDPGEKQLVQMKNEGVKYLIATPVEAAKIAEISTLFPQHLHKMKDATWVYELE